MNENLNVLDRRLLYELDCNARASYAQIARKTRISQERVRYRIKGLVKKGIISRFLAILNTTTLGNSYYQMMVKLQNVDEHKKQELISFLTAHSRIAWIGNLEGSFDISFIIYVKNQLALQGFMEDLNLRFSPSIMKKVISVNLYATFFPRDYLISKERTPGKQSTYQSSEQCITLDPIDDSICKQLGQDARTSCVKIAERIRISSDAVIARMKKLKKDKIILGYTLVLNQEKIGQSHYKILIYLNNVSKNRESGLTGFCSMNNRVIAIIRTLGSWDYEIDIEVQGADQLRVFTMDLTTQFSDIIRDYDTLRIVEMPKYTFFP